MQQHPDIGFKPIFLITCSLYILASILTRGFFQKMDDRQRRVALMKQIGVAYRPYEQL